MQFGLFVLWVLIIIGWSYFLHYYNKANWDFQEDIRTWSINYKLYDKLENNITIYRYFKILTNGLFFWGAYYSVLSVYQIFTGDMPFPFWSMLVFTAIEIGYTWLCFRMMFNYRVSALGLHACIIAFAYLIAHHVQDIMQPDEFIVKFKYSLIDWCYCIHTCLVILYATTSFIKSKSSKYYLMFLFTTSIMFFMRFEIVAMLCINYPCTKYCVAFLNRIING